MPLYEYRCEACGHHFELIRKFSDPPVETCPVCNGPVRKLMSPPAFQFKGSGWYVTDYARKEQPSASQSDEAAKSAATDKGQTGDTGDKKGQKADTPEKSAKAEQSSRPEKGTKPDASKASGAKSEPS
jgi:putative FmdB family regulatory protein